MSNINRNMDPSEQKEAFVASYPNVVNTQDMVVKIVERPCTVTDAKVSLLGISGSPTVLLKVLRFVAGTGGSSFLLGTTFAPLAFGSSGMFGYSIHASGSSQLSLQKGDMIVAVQGGGTGAATTATIVEVVVQNTQDIKSWY